MAKSDYSIEEITFLLASYGELDEGYIPGEALDKWAKVWKKDSSKRAPFEMRAILKADIDRAMQRLTLEEQYIILWLNIDSRTIDDCAFILKLPFYEIVRIQFKAIRSMAGVLHGDKVR